MKKTCIPFFVMILMMISVNAYAYIAPDEISVTDYAGIISSNAKSYINSKNDILFAQTEAKIVFVTTDNTDGLSTEDYAQAVYKDWNMEGYGRGNSIMIVLSVNNDDYSFVKGSGVRYAIDDSLIYEYIVESLEPHFDEGNYDTAVLSMYNSLGSWYEKQYDGLDLSLDKNTSRYIGGDKIRDKEKQPSKLWMWIAAGVCVVGFLIFLKIKRNIEFRIRQHERRMLKKKYKIDIDKIVNS